MSQSMRAAALIAFVCVFEPTFATADAPFATSDQVKVTACQPSAAGYEMQAVAACRGRLVCIEKNVSCKFADKKRFEAELKSDASKLDDTSGSFWAQAALKSIVCLPKDGKCPDDRGACAAQPAKEIGCGWKDIGGRATARRYPAGDLDEAVVMSGVVKAVDDGTVTVLTQGRTITIPKTSVQTPEYAMGQEIFYEVTSQRLVDFFFKKANAATARARTMSSEPGKIRRPPNSRFNSGPDSEPISFDED